MSTEAQAAPTPTTALATPPARQLLIPRFAGKYGVEPAALLTTLRMTCFKQSGNTVVSDQQMMALLVVADQYDLNPFTKEIFAFEDKGNIIPVVSVDGWTRIINSHPNYDGIEFKYAEEHETRDAKAKSCPIWCEVTIYRKDRTRPTILREYLDEVYVPPRGANGYAGPWQSHTKRMLRHKTLIQGARLAFGFAGIYDEDEAIRIINADLAPADATSKAAATGFDDFQQKLEQRVAAPRDANDGNTIGAKLDDGDIVDAEFDDIPVVQRDEASPDIALLGDPTLEEAEQGLTSATTLQALDEAGALLSAFKTHDRHKELLRYYLNRRTELIDK